MNLFLFLKGLAAVYPHKLHKKIGLTLTLFSISLVGSSQSLSYYNYSISNGLPSSEVYDIHQDKNGFLWFATDNGVAKYDGDKFEIFHINQGLTDPVVFGIHEDKNGRLWFRTYSGKLFYYQGKKIKPFEYNETLVAEQKPFTLIYSIYLAENNDLWMGGRQFLGKVTPQGKLKEVSTQHNALIIKKIDNTYVRASYLDKGIDQIVINDKIFPLTLSENTFYEYSFHALEHEKKLYIAINRDIFEYSDDTLKKVFTNPNLIISLSVDRSNNIWVGYLNKGVDRFETNTFKKPFQFTFLQEKSVSNIFEDESGALWVSTLESGIYHIPNTSIENLKVDIEAKIRTVKILGDTLLIGDQAGHLNLLNMASKKITITKTLAGGILTIFQDSKNNIWIGTTINTYLFDKNLVEQKIFKTETTTTFSEDSDGIIWSLGGNRIRKFNLSGELLTNNPINVIYRSILADDSLLFLPGRTGLFTRNKNLTVATSPPQFQNFKITNVAPLNDSILFLSTQGSGFILLHKREWRFEQFDSKNNFIGNNIYSHLLFDSSIIIATEKGLIETSVESLLRNHPNFKILHAKSGLLGEKVNFLERYKNSILAFSDDGVSMIPKEEFTNTKTKPRFYIKDITINQQHLDSSQFENLRFDQNNIQITYGFISFSGNQDILSRFRLSDKGPWIYPANRTIELYSLAPGSYSLDLEFSTDNAVWDSGIHHLKFTIRSPWWRVWYYQAAIVTLFLFLGFIYFKNRLALTKQKQVFLEIINENQQKLLQTEIETTERERSRIAKDLHDIIGTNMVAAKMIIGQLLRKYHEPLTEQVENQLQTIILETKEIIYDLSPPGVERYGLFTLVKNQVEKIRHSTNVKITLNTFGEEPRKNPLNIMILRILQELMTNSLKHAEAKNILIDINVFDDRINIIYEDDGIGFSEHQERNGLGLQNIDSRIESLKGQIKFESGDFGVSYTIDLPISK